ncbi:hypothetical protein BDA99DRAFT_559972 [Phascolomyces articulosus]|uniref:F-box domain-containing protein n=1 Tax=Phascolomyces articulosus TaxID=60185 RepID=A0AAD5KAC3_9FUNG|nr:hypothetical protein BDA99DRAFT_559972 [Phascolomyces articulosus]
MTMLLRNEQNNLNNNNSYTDNINNRADLVQRLTYDVLDIIFSHLSFRERIRSTRVSKGWRCFLLTWPDLWNTIADHHVNLDTNLLPYLPYFRGQYVRTVRMPEFSQQSTRFLINQSCRYIETLEVPCRPATFVSVHDLLLFTCDTLTYLTLHSGVGDALLDTVLDHCPNLISFQYLLSGGFYNLSTPHNEQTIHHNKEYQRRIKLRRLVLDIPLEEQRVLSVLSRCPNLSQLQLRSSGLQFDYFDAILRFIHHYLLRIEYLRLFGASAQQPSSSFSSSLPRSSSSFPSLLPSSSQPQQPCLRELWLIGTDEESTAHILPLMHRHQAALTSLHIRSPLTPNVMHHLGSFSYPAMTELYIQLTHFSPLASDLCNLIHHAPNLTDVSLTSFTATDTFSDLVLDALPSSIQRFKLQLGYNLIHDIVTSEALGRFLKRSTHIQEFHLPNIQAMDDDILDLLSSQHISTLETLDVSSNEHITDVGLRRFVDNYHQQQHIRQVKWLNLGQCSLVTSNSIAYVKEKLSTTKIYT